MQNIFLRKPRCSILFPWLTPSHDASGWPFGCASNDRLPPEERPGPHPQTFHRPADWSTTLAKTCGKPGPPGGWAPKTVLLLGWFTKNMEPPMCIYGVVIFGIMEKELITQKKTSTRTRTMKTYYWISDAIPTSCLARRARIRSHASFVRPSMWPQTKSQQGVDCMKNKIKELKKTPK